MKFAIDRLSLLRPLGHVSSVVERRNTIPILANIVMRADAGQLSLTATDMEMDIAEQISCSVQQEGRVPYLPISFMILCVNCQTGQRWRSLLPKGQPLSRQVVLPLLCPPACRRFPGL